MQSVPNKKGTRDVIEHVKRDRSTRHRPFPIHGPLEPSLSPSVFKILRRMKILGLRPWPFKVMRRHQSHGHSTCHRPFPIGEVIISNQAFIASVLEITGTKHIGANALIFQGHVTSSVTWPFDSQVATSYQCSIVTNSASPAVFEILGPKHIGVTTLPFPDHVTSLVTWPFDSPLAFLLVVHWNQVSISNGFRDILPKPHVLIDTMLNRHCACAISRDVHPVCRI